MAGWIAAASTVASIGGSYLAGQEKADAARDAANAQIDAYGQGMEEQQRRLNEIKTQMQPWLELGQLAMGRQKELLGLGTQAQQQEQIQALEQSPQFQSVFKQGENAILQNASATGGLRGGNIQAALAQFRPSVLSNLINQRIAQFQGLSGQGQQAAGLVSQATQNVANQNTQALQGIGAANAGAFTAEGAANALPFQAIGDIGGTYLGGFLGAYGKNNAGKLFGK